MYVSPSNPSGVNPSSLPCFELCRSCFRCENKGIYAKCSNCSGRHDPDGIRDPYYVDDYCRCTEGVLQYRTKKGQMIIRKFLTNPFKGQVKTDAESQDERDWNSYISDKRETLNNEHYDPIQFIDNSSTHDWTQSHRKGQA